MNIQHFQIENFFYAQIDGLYTEEELHLIQKEIEFLESIKQASDKSNSAVLNQNPLRTGQSLFVDYVYTDRKLSSILTINRKLFSKEIADYLRPINCFYGHIFESDYDSTLLNFYGNDERYGVHLDSSIFTALTFFKVGDFSGGELCFPEYDISIDPVVGRTVIFPGCVRHAARPVSANSGNYRVTMAQFVTYKHLRG